jgi:hypothetical protein
MFVACAAVFAAAAFAAQDSTPEGATLKGKFTFDGDPPAPKQLDCKKEPACCQQPILDQSLVVGKNKEVANVFVYVRTKGLKVPDEIAKKHKDPVLLDNKNCRFEPHALGLVVGQQLVLGNSDDFGHNSNISGQNENKIIPAGQKVPINAKTVTVIPNEVNCNIHGWMKGWVLVRPDPFFAVSNDDGTFKIEGLPVDQDLEFQVWHERAGFVTTVKLDDKATKWDKGRFKKKLKKGVNDLGTIPISAKNFK